MSDHQDFALLLDEYARLKTRHEQLQRERKWLLERVKSSQQALSKTSKELEHLKANRAQNHKDKQPTKKPATGGWAYWTLGIISVCFLPLVWAGFLSAALDKARWGLNGWAVLAIFLIVTPLSVFLALQRSREREQWRERERQYQQQLYQHNAAQAEQMREAVQPAERQRGKTPRRHTQKPRAPITRKLSEAELEPIANAH